MELKIDTHSDGVPPPAAGDLHRRVNGIQTELEQAFLELVARRKAAAGVHGAAPGETLRLSLELPPPGAPGQGRDQLFEQLLRAADRFVDRFASVPLGRVYCHWCGSFRCDHSAPAEPRSVFGGYTATGQPTWPELASVLLEKRHPRIDALFRQPPVPIAIVQGGGELSQDQLPVYGKRSPVCRILGQVAFGYLQYPDALCLPQANGSDKVPLAVTFQVVEAGSRGAPLVLNILGKLPGDGPDFVAFEESSDARMCDALLSTRRALEELSLLGGNRRRREGERRRRALGALHRLARNLERIFRQRERRTHHSQDRHLDRKRPASTALGDALHASPKSIFRDVEARTWVVVGPKNRVHVFNDGALHVTSVVYPGETVRHRTTRGKWLTPQPDEMAAFQAALRRRASVE
ncbi:MAG: hypothetical protein HY721_35465 [Planctomycetes bacterium]|nr:hypothetical protein [Planctomycetota bacterium]